MIFFFQKMSHSAEKCKRGDPLGFINIYSVAKYQKTRKGDSFETLKNFRKKSHNAEKKSNLLVSSGFVGYGKKVTSRDRPKSAPYPRLKNSKKTSKCQVFFYSTRKSKIFRKFFLKKLHTKKWTEWRAGAR